ncbi:MAG: dipeptidase [Tannerella sp.]|jgi:acetylornithine deacetylase/succinyl-diaminopimelate desuccinylase-like protein|nr:dipeptidase [Tannerella sp.]
MSIKTYIQENREPFLAEWFDLLRIPSVSSQHVHRADMHACAALVRDMLLASGADRAEVMPATGPPVVYGERILSPGAPTVLVYGHYDVMPPEPLELWNSNPFEPVIRDGAVWARGADDDKGQLMIQLKGFQTALHEGLVGCNVKFVVEGEEETGSAGLTPFCETHRDLLKTDVILVSDTSMYSEDVPSLTTGLRGLSYWEIEVTGPNRDLHSGHFGGAVANPLNVLCRLLADVTDSNGRITIPHFYDDVQELTPEEREMMAQAPFDEAKYRQAIGVDALAGEAGYSTLERNSCRPSFDICGIRGGYTGEGAKTVLPSSAIAKVSCRLVPHQDAARITQLFADSLTAAAPDSVKLRVTHCHSGQPYLCPVDLPAYRAAERAFAVAFGKKPLAMRRGGSIPIVPAFERILGAKTVLMGFGLERHAIHSPNENFGLERFLTGIEAVAEFYGNWQ